MKTATRNNIWLFLISALSWIVLIWDPGSLMTVAHCPVSDSGASMASFEMMLEMNPFSSLMTGWAIMLAAMMLPTLTAPVRHVSARSLKRRRWRSILLFIAGYAAIWMAAGFVLLMAVLAINVLAPRSYLPAVIVGITAIAWQCSPVKQRFLNRNHNHRQLKAFGFAADIDVFSFGLIHGVWCVGAGWALMLLPMLVPQAHLTAMALVTYVMISERLERPAIPAWRLRFPGKLARIAIAQIPIYRQIAARYSASRPYPG